MTAFNNVTLMGHFLLAFSTSWLIGSINVINTVLWKFLYHHFLKEWFIQNNNMDYYPYYDLNGFLKNVINMDNNYFNSFIQLIIHSFI